MSDQSPPSSPSMAGPQRRRSSITELFNRRSSTNPSSTVSSSPPTATIPTTTSTSAPKRMSLTTVGLGGNSPNPNNPFTAFARQRRASVATSSGSGSPEYRNSFGDEPAVVEEDDQSSVLVNTPVSPSFARRVSFGAQALRDVRQGNGSGGAGSGGRRTSSSHSSLIENTPSMGIAATRVSSPTASKTTTARTSGEGFNWSEALRDKTKRSPSISSPTNLFANNSTRTRAATTATVEPPKEMPKAPAAPPKLKKPDHLGERMLRGDFMMD